MGDNFHVSGFADIMILACLRSPSVRIVPATI